MLLPCGVYEKAGIQMGQPLIQMSDFTSLIALSQKHQAPIFDLTVVRGIVGGRVRFSEILTEARGRYNAKGDSDIGNSINC